MTKHDFYLRDTGISMHGLRCLVNLLIEEGFTCVERRELISENKEFLAYPCVINALMEGEMNVRNLLNPPYPVIYN